LDVKKVIQLPDLINVSALNQYSYCPRRCGLIYVEDEFSNNAHTSRGNAEHEKVDRIGHATSKDGARVEYALPIWSDCLGLIGKCDVVEFWPDGTIYPVEYKHGAKKKRENDDLQLAAQALCLEEMCGRSVERGAIFHAKSKRRRELIIDMAIRDRLVQVVESIRAMLATNKLPSPVNDERCAECSMQEICQPEALARLGYERNLYSRLFDPE
jgi:CRISPR-associated exonuclease Cas4